MRNKLAWLFSIFILFLGLMTIDTNAQAATKTNAQNSLFQAITYETTDSKLCDMTLL